jgi:hypothetical protein
VLVHGYVAVRGMKCGGKLNRVWVHGYVAIQIEGNGAVCQTTDNIDQNRYCLVPTPPSYLHRNLSSLFGRTGVVRQKRVGYVAIRRMKCEGKLNRVLVHNARKVSSGTKILISWHCCCCP